MADVINTTSFGELFNIPAANASESHRDTHEPAPSEADSVPDLEHTVQLPCPVYKDTPVEPDPYLMLSYKVCHVWKLSAELRAALAHIKLLADIILCQGPAPGRSLHVEATSGYHIAIALPHDALSSPTSGGYDLSL